MGYCISVVYGQTKFHVGCVDDAKRVSKRFLELLDIVLWRYFKNKGFVMFVLINLYYYLHLRKMNAQITILFLVRLAIIEDEISQ